MPNDQRMAGTDSAEAQHQQQMDTRIGPQDVGTPDWQELVHQLLQVQMHEFQREAELVRQQPSQRPEPASARRGRPVLDSMPPRR